MIDSIRSIFLKELRAWRHRFWWLPMAGAACVILPMALAPLPQMPSPELLQQQPWMQSRVMFATIPAEWLTGVTIALGMGASILASWLGYALRWSEVHNNTLTDVALTRVKPLEMAVGQVLAVWVVTLMALAGAVPALVFYATMAGRSAAHICLGVVALALYPLIAAASGYGSMWWKQLVRVSVRGRSYVLFIVGVTLLFTALCIPLGLPFAYPLHLWTYGFSKRDLWTWTELCSKSLFWGTPILCLLWLAGVGLRGLWRRRWGGKLLSLLVGLLLVAGGIEMARSASGWLSSLVAQAGQTSPFPRGDPLIFMGLGLVPLGAARAFGGQWESTEWMNTLDPYLLTGTGLGLAYLSVIALASFVFAVGDLAWTMKNPWAIAVLQDPKRAVMRAPETARRPRRVNVSCLFITRNPVYDLCLARSTSVRGLLVAGFGLFVLALTLSLAYVWDIFLKSPTDRLVFELVFGGVLFFAMLLCVTCGWSCGSSVSRFKQQGQWSALLTTPLRLRTILLGVCLPNLGDAMMVGVMLLPLLAVGTSVGLAQWVHVGLVFVLLFLAFLLGAVASLFSSAFTKNAATDTLLSILLTVVLTAGAVFIVAGLDDLFPLTAYPRQWWETWTPPIGSLIVLAVVCVILAWLACRRLRWDR